MTSPRSAGRGSGRFTTYAFRAAGLVLIGLVLVPAYRLLQGDGAGRFPLGSVAAAELASSLLFFGSLIVIVLAIVFSRLLVPSSIDGALSRLGKTLAAVPLPWFAGGLALMAGAFTLSFSLLVLDGKPNLIDAMVQLVHARYVAAGQLAGPVEFMEFWQLQNSLVTPNGWVSQYPPGYVLFLAAGLRLGIVEIVGPFFLGITVLFTALAAERLLPDDRPTARLGALLLSFSPFLMAHAGAFMNHIGAAAFTAAAIYFALRSRDGRALPWALLAGAATGAVFSIRPLSAIVTALVVAVIWLSSDSSDPGVRVAHFLRRTLAATIGIAPILAAVGAYNQHFFGSPFVFGYLAAQGPLTGLGFHRDPTGAPYGLIQALGYTSSDLVAFGLFLLETPISVVLVAGLFLLLAERFPAGVRVVVVWALLPILANALYWHHGVFMGPRMLNEAAPAWALLTAVAAVGLVRLMPGRTWGSYSPRAALILTFALAWIAGVLYLGPQRLASYGGPWMESSRIEPVRGSRPSLVFVHGAWTGRVVSRLAARGMRVDSLEAVMRQNTTCDSHNYALPVSGRGERPPIDFSIVPVDPPPLMTIAAGDEIRVRSGQRMSVECLREIASDTLGIVDVGPLLWQGDLPGLGGNGAMFVRDLGPEANARLIERYPERIPSVLLRPRDDAAPQLVPYAEGMKRLWSVR